MNNSVKKTPLDSWNRKKINFLSGDINFDIKNYQLERIRDIVRLARGRSIFYKSSLEHFNERDIRSLDDFFSFPFTSESDIKEHALQMLCVSQDSINRVVTLDSSGTTGIPKRIYFTGNDQELTIDFFMHGMSTLTDRGDRVMILLPCEKPGSVGDLLVSAVSTLGAIPVRHGVVKNISAAAIAIQESDSNVIVGIPVQLLALARYYELSGINNVSIKSILLSTDYVPQIVVSELEKVFGCKVFSHYGMTEMGLGGGIDCCSHSGYHLREADLYFEIVNTDSGENMPDGEYGEVVFTTITRDGMPLIRYRTGDISRFLQGVCKCGSHLRRMDYIRKRKNSAIEMDNGHSINISDLDELLFKIRGIIDYSVSVTDRGEEKKLEFEIIALHQAADRREVIDTISGIPGTNELIENGKLEIKVKSGICGNDYTPAAVKRKINFLQ